MKQGENIIGYTPARVIEYQKADGTVEIIEGRDPIWGAQRNRHGNVLLWCPDRPRNWRQLRPEGILKSYAALGRAIL